MAATSPPTSRRWHGRHRGSCGSGRARPKPRTPGAGDSSAPGAFRPDPSWTSREHEGPGDGSGAPAREGARPGVHRGVVELLLDPQQLVVLGRPVGASGRARLDLAGTD